MESAQARALPLGLAPAGLPLGKTASLLGDMFSGRDGMFHSGPEYGFPGSIVPAKGESA